MKFVTLTGLNTYNTNILSLLGDKVDKDGNKVLSANDFTDALKAKLDALTTEGLATATEVNEAIAVIEANIAALDASTAEGLSTLKTTLEGTISAAETTAATNLSAAVTELEASIAALGASNTDDLDKAVTELETSIAALGSALKWKGAVGTVEELPTEVEVGDMYTVTATGAEYAWNGTEYYELGRIINLDNFLTSDDLVEATTEEINGLFS